MSEPLLQVRCTDIHQASHSQNRCLPMQQISDSTASAAAAMDGLCPGKADWQQTIIKSKLQAPALTKQDAAFEKEGCEFVWGLEELTVDDLNSLFKKARIM